MRNLLISGLANVLTGLLLALIIFLIRERFFAPVKLVGRWYVKLSTLESSLGTFRGMHRIAVMYMVSDGKVVSGTGEIVYEDSVARKKRLTAKERFRFTVAGTMEHRIFGADVVALHLVVAGPKRSTSEILETKVSKGPCAKSGKFWSSAGDQSGSFTLQSEPFPELLKQNALISKDDVGA